MFVILMERSDEGIDLELVADLTEEDEEFVLCKSGKGGKGKAMPAAAGSPNKRVDL